MGAKYSPEDDILYVRFQEGEITNSISLDDLTIIDYSDDAPVAVEFIGASGGVDLSKVPFSHKVEALIRDEGLAFPIFA